MIIDVEETLKGKPAQYLQVLDTNSYDKREGPGEWVGSSGACGAFDFDPTGIQAIYVLLKRDRHLRTSRCAGNFLLEPERRDDAALLRAIDETRREIGPNPYAVTGKSDSGNWPVVVALVSVAFGFSVSLGTLLVTRGKP